MDLLSSSRGWSLKCPEDWSSTPVKMTRGLEHFSRLRELGLFRLEKRGFWRDLGSICLYLKGALQEIWGGTLCHGM